MSDDTRVPVAGPSSPPSYGARDGPSAEGFVRALRASGRLRPFTCICTPTARELDLLETRVFNLVTQYGGELYGWVTSMVIARRHVTASTAKGDSEMRQTVDSLSKHMGDIMMQVSHAHHPSKMVQAVIYDLGGSDQVSAMR
jgi:hypothetical protein